MKILNLYGGIGGNRKLWGDEHEITAVELDENIAKVYARYFPNDKIVIGDAHKYLLEHFAEFDFIWSSPPCPTHSRLRNSLKRVVYPDMNLYEEIILLQKWFKGKFVVENVIPYYKPLINPTVELSRHYYWANFRIEKAEFEFMNLGRKRKEREFLQGKFGYDLSNFTGIDKRKVLRNCVTPEMGLHILQAVISENQGQPIYLDF